MLALVSPRPGGRFIWFASKLTRQCKEYDPVHDQHRPEDWQVEDGEEAADKANGDRLGSRVPELELW